MTAYWPTSAIMRELPQEHRSKIMCAPRVGGIPAPTMVECYRATGRIVADTTIAFVFSEGVTARRVYLQTPSFEQWHALERSGFVEMWDEFGFVIDALH